MVEKNLDFRSDTVTWPSPEMREAAANAAVGDMGYGEDPSVNELERLAAEKLGKEAAIFVTSGTQGNAVSLLAHTQRGDEIILEERAHIYTMEKGHWSLIGGLIPKLVKGVNGWLPPEDVRALIRGRRGRRSNARVLCLENTNLSSGGTPVPPAKLKEDWDVAKEYDVGVHMDGARIFNAAVALEIDVKEIARYADTIQFCLSKGLGAPVGSLVVGTDELIEKAKKYRSVLGGSMRQAGIIAAPGIVALTKMVDRLAEDHTNAKLLGDGLASLGFKLNTPVKSNMVFIDLSSIGWTGEDWTNACTKLGWKSRGSVPSLRLCTHYGIEEEDIKKLLEGLSSLI